MKGNTMAVLLYPSVGGDRKEKLVETEPEDKLNQRPSRTLLANVIISMGLVLTQSVVCFVSFFPRLSFGFFNNGVVKVYDIFRVSISPSELFFSMLPVCQAGQVGIVGYSLMSLCRRTLDGPRLSNPSILNSIFFILWNTATALNIAWNFVFDKVFLPESGVLLALHIATMLPAFGIASTRLAFFQPQLIADNRRSEIALLRSGVLNVLAMQITQSVISLVIDLTVIASAAFTKPGIQELISSISLGTMAAITLIFTGLDVSYLEPYTRSVLSPYFAMVMSVLSMMKDTWNVAGPSSTLKLAVLASTVTGLVTKLAVSVYNRNKVLNPGTCQTMKEIDLGI